MVIQSPFISHVRIVCLVPRPSQADSAAFADDYAHGNVSRVAGFARRRYRQRMQREETPGSQQAGSAGLPDSGYVSDCGARWLIVRLDRIAEAHRYLESNQQVGKVVVTV